MSDIPRARKILVVARNTLSMNKGMQKALDEAIPLLNRRKPKFRVYDGRQKRPKEEIARQILAIRAEVNSVEAISKLTGVAPSRISEIINPPEKK